MRRTGHLYFAATHDVAVALAIATEEDADWIYATLSARVAVSTGEISKSLRRLELSRLFLQSERRVATPRLIEFIEHGVPFVYPPQRTGPTHGVATGWSSPVMRNVLVAAESRPLVWPALDGEAGDGLVPLYPGAVDAARGDPRLYDLLALVDALRTGGARQRREAGKLLRSVLRGDDVD